MDQTPIEKVARWKKEASELESELETARDGLKAEIDRLKGQLADVERNLELARSVAKPGEKTARSRVVLRPKKPQYIDGRESFTALLERILREADGMKAAELCEAVRQERPDVTDQQVHTGLYRLQKQKRIRKHGRKGKYTYRTRAN